MWEMYFTSLCYSICWKCFITVIYQPDGNKEFPSHDIKKWLWVSFTRIILIQHTFFSCKGSEYWAYYKNIWIRLATGYSGVPGYQKVFIKFIKPSRSIFCCLQFLKSQLSGSVRVICRKHGEVRSVFINRFLLE